MKKIMLFSSAVVLMAAFTNFNANAQEKASVAKNSSSKGRAAATAVVYTSSANGFNSAVNTKALRSFYRDFKSISNASWFKEASGFVAVFEADGAKTRAFYTNKGISNGSISRYGEANLTAEIRNMISSTYSNFSISLINEVTVNAITAYVIKLEGKNSWKTVRVMDGEMDTIEEYKKG